MKDHLKRLVERAANVDEGWSIWRESCTANLRAEAYDIEVKLSTTRVVHSAFVRFRGLPAELGLSGHTHQVLAIKIEVDTKPPAGVTETTVVRRHVCRRELLLA